MADNPKTHNEAGEQAPSTVEQQAPDVAEQNAPATSEPQATNIPSANAPDPEAANAETNPNAATTSTDKKPAAKKAPKPADTEDAKPAAKAKKEKPPALEDKPFAEFMQQHYLPSLKDGLAKQGIEQVSLSFEKRKVDVVGFSTAPECWQVIGRLNSDQKQTRAFNIYFFDEDIKGQKGFSYSDSGSKFSTLESFMIDERKVDLGLLVLYTLQRLNAQKWLVRN